MKKKTILNILVFILLILSTYGLLNYRVIGFHHTPQDVLVLFAFGSISICSFLYFFNELLNFLTNEK